MNFLSLFTEKELLIMALVIAGLLLIVIILAILELLDRKKNFTYEENLEEVDMNTIEPETTLLETSEITNQNIEVNKEELEIKTNL